jgi:hypothetical protein
MSDLSERTVAITLGDLDKMRAENGLCLARIQELERQLVEAKMADPTGTIANLRAVIQHAIPIVQFATGNLEPSTVRGWPYAALSAFAEAIAKMPDADTPILESAQDLRTFAKVAAGYEEFRRERDAKRAVMPATREDFGPKTDEAAFAHAAREQALGQTPGNGTAPADKP